MNFSLTCIEEAADQIIQKLKSGEIKEACCMASISSPVTEAWDKAHELLINASLSYE